VWSSTLALGACVLIASMPFSALAFVSYPWLAAMISPLGALRWNRNLAARRASGPVGFEDELERYRQRHR
jgi:hypothetical protein